MSNKPKATTKETPTSRNLIWVSYRPLPKDRIPFVLDIFVRTTIGMDRHRNIPMMAGDSVQLTDEVGGFITIDSRPPYHPIRRVKVYHRGKRYRFRFHHAS